MSQKKRAFMNKLVANDDAGSLMREGHCLLDPLVVRPLSSSNRQISQQCPAVTRQLLLKPQFLSSCYLRGGHDSHLPDSSSVSQSEKYHFVLEVYSKGNREEDCFQGKKKSYSYETLKLVFPNTSIFRKLSCWS